MMETAYQTHYKLLCLLAWKFHRMTRIDWDDCLSLANEYFVEAVLTHDGRSPLGKRLGWYVWRRMVRTLDKKTRTNKNLSLQVSSTKLDFQTVPQPERFSLNGFFTELSEDAREVVTLVLDNDPPPYLTRTKQYRYDLSRTLRGFGWSVRKIRETFEEITEALG